MAIEINDALYQKALTGDAKMCEALIVDSMPLVKNRVSKWTGLTEGFRSVVTELPKIAARQIGPIESGLGQDMDAISKSVGSSFDSFINNCTATMADSTKKLSGSVHGLFDKLRHPDFGKMPALTAPGVGNLAGDNLLAGERRCQGGRTG